MQAEAVVVVMEERLVQEAQVAVVRVNLLEALDQQLLEQPILVVGVVVAVELLVLEMAQVVVLESSSFHILVAKNLLVVLLHHLVEIPYIHLLVVEA
jgi:hypothetical protein